MPGESNKEPASQGNQLPVKWIVLGVIAISFMLIFKSELGGLLERTSDLKISASGLEIKAEPKSVDTPIGPTQVSVVPVARAPQVKTGIQNSTYTSVESGFQISWPNNTDWRADEAFGVNVVQSMGLGDTVKIPITIFSTHMIESVTPNINVAVEQAGQMSIEDYMVAAEANVEAMGVEIVSSSIDEETNGAIIVAMNYMYGAPVYQFQKIAITNGKAYIVTATQVPKGDTLTQGLRSDLASIINSFRVIQ